MKIKDAAVKFAQTKWITFPQDEIDRAINDAIIDVKEGVASHFLAGAEFMLAEVLKELRSEEADQYTLQHEEEMATADGWLEITSDKWADWIEKRMKERG